MADERIQELLRELRERWGVKAVAPVPPQDVLEWLAREACFEPNEESLGHQTSTRGAPRGLLAWLRSFGVERMCLAAHPTRRARCNLPVNHPDEHKLLRRYHRDDWPVASLTWDRDEGPCDATYDSGRLRCVLSADHGGYHNYESAKAEPTHPRHADLA